MRWGLITKSGNRDLPSASWVEWFFAIDTQESLDTGNGYVSTRYDVVFRNPQTNEVIRVLNFNDTFQQLVTITDEQSCSLV